MMFVFYLAEVSIPDEKGNLYQKGAMGMFDCFYESFFKTVNKKGPKVSEEISYPSKTIVLFTSFFLLIFWNLVRPPWWYQQGGVRARRGCAAAGAAACAAY